MLRAITATAPAALFVALSLAGPVAAQDVSQEGALRLQTQLKAIVGQYLLPATEAVDYEMDGPIVATPAGDRYEATLPGITVALDSDADLRIDPIPVTVTPQANGWNRATWTLPSVFSILNPNGSERLDITLGDQRSDILVAPEYNSVMAADVALGNVSVVTDALPGTATLGELSVRGDYREVGPETYDLTGQYGLTHLLIDLEEMEGVRVALAGAQFGGDIAGLRMDLFASLARLTQNYAGVEPDSAFFQELNAVVQNAGPGAWFSGLTMALSVDGFDLVTPDGSGGADRGEIRFGFAGLDLPTGRIDAGLTLEGISASDLPADILPAIPTTARLDMGLESLPAAQLGAVAKNFIAGAAQSGPDNAMGMAAIEMMGLAMSSDPLLAIERLYLEAPLGYLSGNGRIQPDATSPLGAVGSASLTVGGLPDLIAFMQSGVVPDGDDIAVFLTTVSAMGRDETDGSGAAVKVFDLEMTPAGQVLLNGNDMGPILDAL